MQTDHIAFSAMDSCRHDSLVAASMPDSDRIGRAGRRFEMSPVEVRLNAMTASAAAAGHVVFSLRGSA